MVIISKQLCSSSMLSFRTIIPGRLIHLRLHLKPRYLDVVAVYQHPGHSSADLAARSILWDHLHTTLQSLARRHGLLSYSWVSGNGH